MTTLHDRSRKVLLESGWRVDLVERWLPRTRRRKDLYGFGDLLAFDSHRVMIVQVTDHVNITARMRKIDAIPEAHEWVALPGRLIHAHGWRQSKGIWEVRIEELTTEGWRRLYE